MKITCPCCKGSYEIEYTATDVESATANCRLCGALLIFKSGVALDFHTYLHQSDPRWPKDGKGTHSVEVVVSDSEINAAIEESASIPDQPLEINEFNVADYLDNEETIKSYIEHLYPGGVSVGEECPTCGKFNVRVEIAEAGIPFYHTNGESDLVITKFPCHSCNECEFAWFKGSEAEALRDAAVAKARKEFDENNL